MRAKMVNFGSAVEVLEGRNARYRWRVGEDGITSIEVTSYGPILFLRGTEVVSAVWPPQGTVATVEVGS